MNTHLVRLSVGLALVLVFFGATGAAWAADPAPSNLDLMVELSTQAVGDVVDNIAPLLDGRGVRLRPYANNESYQFLTNIVTTVLRSRGIDTYQPARQGQSTIAGEEGVPLTLTYQAIQFDLSYNKVYRSHLVGGKRVKRGAEVRILGQLVRESDGAVEWIGEAGASHDDEFAFREISRMEEGSFPFVRPTMPGTGWGKLVEPVFVSGIIVGLIYLFFSNQSDN